MAPLNRPRVFRYVRSSQLAGLALDGTGTGTGPAAQSSRAWQLLGQHVGARLRLGTALALLAVPAVPEPARSVRRQRCGLR